MTKDISVIPPGMYCYTMIGVSNMRLDIIPCPYWSLSPDHEDQDNGYCAFLESGDWEDDGMGLLWDQVKACGENDDYDIE